MEAKTQLKQTTKWTVRALDPEGNVKWEDTYKNVTVDEGLDELLDKAYLGSAYTAQHYIGLTDGTPTFAPGDTMGTHAGWAEVTAYSEAARGDLTAAFGTVSGQSLSTSATIDFSINADATTIGGAFITTDSTKGGTAGILIGGDAFSAGDKSLDNGDTLQVSVTVSLASA